MFERIRQLLAEQGILLSAAISLADCTVKKSYLLERAGIGETGTAVVFAIPYHTPTCEAPDRNLSRYAVGRDYHLFVKELSQNLLPRLQDEFPSSRFALFADHSPIDEREAAAKAGLGIIGRHGLLITEPYSSHVFVGELVTDEPLLENLRIMQEIATCENCGACLAACPYVKGEIGECLSALTQKKGALKSQEEQALVRYGTVWGCDICQEACPHTKKALLTSRITSPIAFFHGSPTPHLTYDGIREMSDAEFSERAYSWRGREVILRNLAVTERENEGEQTNSKKP